MPKDRQEGVDGRIQDHQRGPRRSWDGPQRGLAALKVPKCGPEIAWEGLVADVGGRK